MTPDPFDADTEDYVYVLSQDKEAQQPPVNNVIRYDQFVKQLFKADTAAMMALHCAVGVAGEVGELINADINDDEEICEELGDLEFYLQATRLHYTISRRTVLHHYSGNKISGWFPVSDHFAIGSGDLCEVVKREYIYRKPRDLEALANALGILEDAMKSAYGMTYVKDSDGYELFDVNDKRRRILQLNAEKLSKRYVELRYSDQAAIARADKAPGT